MALFALVEKNFPGCFFQPRVDACDRIARTRFFIHVTCCLTANLSTSSPDCFRFPPVALSAKLTLTGHGE
jgi:hypothetical protein